MQDTERPDRDRLTWAVGMGGAPAVREVVKRAADARPNVDPSAAASLDEEIARILGGQHVE